LKKKIEEEIETRKEIYKKSPSDMISAYNREIETEKEYNGRQLLELLQNADDEQSDEVLIELDTKKNTLTISNCGDNCTPFSYKGIRSLMISNLSSKRSTRFIGNKGLGFRSIINWGKKITINSNGLDIIYSRDIVDNTFNELFDINEQAKIRKDEEISENINPIAFLSIPNIIENTQNDWTTSITIQYKNNYLQDIQKQIYELRDEIILFLNHIEKLVVKIDNDIQLNIKKETLLKKWKIYEKKGNLPKEFWNNQNEEENFDLKIALQDNLDNDIKELFSYFPTKIDINFPFIIHGIFELNSSRNELNNSPKNRYILKQLVKLIVETAKDITKEEVSYKPLEMLSYKHENKHKILEELEFYKAIDNAIEELEIFPCLDGKYRKMSEVIYSNELSIFVKDTSNQNLFNNLLIPINDKISFNSYHLNTSIETKSLNDLSKNIKSIDERIELIYLFYTTFTHKHKLIFLIDENQELVNLNDEVYTPISKDYNFTIPSFVKIKFIHQELFDKLILKFKIVSTDKARELQRKLKEITNIQSYEPAQVLQKIITSTNKELEKEDSNHSKIIKEMVQSLYKNYRLLDKTKIPSETRIQLLNKDNDLYDSKKLFLSKSYPSGELTELLFEDIIPDKAFLADISIYDFKSESLEDIEAFFIWLGVNKHTRFESITEDNHYINFVFTQIKKPTSYRDSSLQLKKIYGYKELIKTLSPEKIILWFILDEKIKIQLDNSLNTDLFKYSKDREYRGYHYHTIQEKASYILYQIISSGIFKNYLITTDKLSKLANENTIDFNSKLFKKFDIGEHDIKALLLKIGAVEKFEDLSIKRVKEILRDLPNKNPDGKQTQTIYKAIRNHKAVLNDSNIKLCAKKDGELGYYNRDEVYYVNSRKLPKNILNDTAIINIPPRLGNVIEFFGIKDVKDIKIDIKSHNRNEGLTKEFKEFFEKIKTYILVYRFENLKDESTKKSELSKLKDTEIFLCDDISYEKNSIESKLSNNDYLSEDKIFYIKIENKVLNEIKRTLDFRETFADIIGAIFNISTIDNFDRIVSDEIEETEEIIKRNIGYEALQEAREYLNIADEFSSFWRVIYQLKKGTHSDKYIIDKLDDIKEELNVLSNIVYMDYKNLNSYTVIIELFKELDISVEEFNDKAYYKIDFREYHIKNLKNTFNDNLFKFKQLLHKKCEETSTQKEFLNRIGEYENYSQEFENRLDINYQEIVKEFIKETFGFDLDDEIESIDLESIYDTNKKKIDFEEIEASNEYRSLLYFDSKIDEIKTYIKSLIPIVSKSIIENDSAKKIKEIVSPTLSTPKQSHENSSQPSTKPHKVTSSQNKRNKEIGDNAEQEVYNSLVKEFKIENVEWVSKNDDTAGYDIKYKNEAGEWKYVEVKKYSNQMFYLSKGEKEFAEENKDNYEIFLVGDDIYKIDNIDFTDSSKLTLEVEKYKVYYVINEK